MAWVTWVTWMFVAIGIAVALIAWAISTGRIDASGEPPYEAVDWEPDPDRDAALDFDRDTVQDFDRHAALDFDRHSESAATEASVTAAVVATGAAAEATPANPAVEVGEQSEVRSGVEWDQPAAGKPEPEGSQPVCHDATEPQYHRRTGEPADGRHEAQDR